jgi:DHA2 family multidrug resistance protein-like MFS transporter
MLSSPATTASLGPRRWWALGALALSVLAVALDTTVLNLALPTLASALRASTSALQWFVDAYSLVFAAALLPAGLVGDRYGRKRLLLFGLGLFGLASLACAYSPSVGALIAARAVLGLGGAFLMALSVSVLPVLFSEEERPKAIAAWVGANAIGWPLGPILGGWLLSNFWWGSVFLINVPVVALALVAVAVLIPESRSPECPRLDTAGIVTSSAGLTALTYGFIDVGETSWSNAVALAAIGAGTLLLVAFMLMQRRLSRRPGGRPLIDLTLFTSASFNWGTILATGVAFALVGLLFAVPQYFQAIGGIDSLGTGLRLLPLIGGLTGGAFVANRLERPLGAKLVVTLGFVLLAAGLSLGASTNLHSGDGFALAWIAVVGVGSGFALPTGMGAAVSALSAERSGVGSAVMTAIRQVGGTIGVAILGTVLSSGYRSHIDVVGLPASTAQTARKSVSAGVALAQRLGSEQLLHSVQKAFVHGMDVMLWTSAGLMLCAIVLTLAFLPRQSPATAEADVDHAEEARHELVA